MPIPSPFYPRTLELCRSMLWKDWAGYYTVRSFDSSHEREYFAIREGAALIDVTPLFKYDVVGPDAATFLAFVMTRNIEKLGLGRVVYCTWTDRHGRMIDDGTVARLGEEFYRVTSADPGLDWFRRHARGFNVKIEDTTRKLGALALQGPTSRDILKQVSDADMDGLRYFGATEAKLAEEPVVITRTGYTGDLGYEIWVENKSALAVWDALVEEGKKYALMPVGLDGMDVARIEAGLIMAGVDYRNARTCLEPHQTSSPYEIGLGWTVKLDREPFIGQKALAAEKERGSEWAAVGLVISWEEIEQLHDALSLPPNLPHGGWRSAIPVYDGDEQVGYATSGAWSPLLKKNLALATVPTRYAKIGTELQFEVTVEFFRRKVSAVVTETPFFNPERKRS